MGSRVCVKDFPREVKSSSQEDRELPVFIGTEPVLLLLKRKSRRLDILLERLVCPLPQPHFFNPLLSIQSNISDAQETTQASKVNTKNLAELVVK